MERNTAGRAKLEMKPNKPMPGRAVANVKPRFSLPGRAIYQMKPETVVPGRAFRIGRMGRMGRMKYRTVGRANSAMRPNSLLPGRPANCCEPYEECRPGQGTAEAQMNSAWPAELKPLL